jgi:demethylmenaquinone methyltransferase / 2-methoxy-6-polyprenyl-1,4-benzoquinol methylase
VSVSKPNRDTLISKSENRMMFDAIARKYDLMNRIISLGRDAAWRKKAIEALSLTPFARVLDVGSGTGDLAIDIVRTAPQVEVVGLDPAVGMLTVGREKMRRVASDKPVSIVVGDAMTLPFSDEVFDGVVLGFCIRNVEDRLAAVREFRRVLKPSGRLVILELTVPKNPLLSFGHLLYTGSVIPLVSFVVTKKGAYDYLVKSVRAFPKADAFLSAMTAVGFRRGSAMSLMLGSVTLFVLEK